MKHVIRLFIIALLCSIPAYGQVAPAPVAPSTCVNNGGSGLSNLSVSGSATGFAVVGSSSSAPLAATIADVSFQATCHISAGYETLIVPTVADYNFAMAHYTIPLSSLIGKNLTAKLNFDASKVWVDFKGGVGKVVQSNLNKSSFAATIGPTVSIPLNSFVTWNTVGVQYVYGHLAGTSGVIVQPNGLLSNMSVSSGISLSLGAKR